MRPRCFLGLEEALHAAQEQTLWLLLPFSHIANVLGSAPIRAADSFFRRRICRLWRSVLVRRSQRAQVGWDRLNPLLDRWIPAPCILHPYPDKRFDAIHPQ